MTETVTIIISLAAIWLTLYFGYSLSVKHFDER